MNFYISDSYQERFFPIDTRFFTASFADIQRGADVIVQLQSGRFTFNSFMMGLVPAFAINFVLGSYIPILKIGNLFARLFIKDEKNPLFYFFRMFAIVLIMTSLMSFLVMFSEMGFTPVLLFAFGGSFLPTFLYAYVVAVTLFPSRSTHFF